MIALLVSYLNSWLGEIVRESHSLTLPVISLLLALLSWRLWTFTFRPLLKPDEIRYLPYWIPRKSLSDIF